MSVDFSNILTTPDDIFEPSVFAKAIILALRRDAGDDLQQRIDELADEADAERGPNDAEGAGDYLLEYAFELETMFMAGMGYGQRNPVTPADFKPEARRRVELQPQEAPSIKRPVGRPRAVAPVVEEKRGPGRPRKVVNIDEARPTKPRIVERETPRKPVNKARFIEREPMPVQARKANTDKRPVNRPPVVAQKAAKPLPVAPARKPMTVEQRNRILDKLEAMGGVEGLDRLVKIAKRRAA